MRRRPQDAATAATSSNKTQKIATDCNGMQKNAIEGNAWPRRFSAEGSQSVSNAEPPATRGPQQKPICCGNNRNKSQSHAAKNPATQGELMG